MGLGAATFLLISLYLDIQIELDVLGSCIALLLLSNILFSHPKIPTSENNIFTLLLFDIVLIWISLKHLGGANNPFSILYLTYVVFSAILLSPFKTTILTTITILLFGLLLNESGNHHHSSLEHSAHLKGMWLAYCFTSLLCSSTVSLLARLLKSSLHENEVLQSKQLRLSSLTTLAAGAAHELRTPLNTITLCLENITYKLRAEDDKIINDQISIMNNEIQRCSNIIKDMSANSSEIEGEVFNETNVYKFINEISEELRLNNNSNISINVSQNTFNIPTKAVRRSIISLIKNSLESSKEVFINLSISNDQTHLFFKIEDNGPGIDEEIIKDLGAPFITTKPPGQGMGLGVFLSKLTANTFNGDLLYEKASPHGTISTFSIKFE